jgi:hypothetical protein
MKAARTEERQTVKEVEGSKGVVVIISVHHDSTDWKRCGSVRSRRPTWWAARHSGFAQAEAIEMSFLMNKRGLMERVMLEVGLDLGVIRRSGFTMSVFIAVLNTAITGPSLEGVGTRRGVPLPDGDTDESVSRANERVSQGNDVPTADDVVRARADDVSAERSVLGTCVP